MYMTQIDFNGEIVQNIRFVYGGVFIASLIFVNLFFK